MRANVFTRTSAATRARMRARGQHGDRAASVATDHGRPLGADGVEHGDEIVGRLLEERFSGGPSRIGETGAPPIEDEHATERRQSLHEAGQRPEIPHRLDVAEPPGKEHDVDRPVADDLVGHVLVADACVSDVGPQHDPQYARRAFGAPTCGCENDHMTERPSGEPPGWWLDELAHAGAEHLEPDYVAGYEAKAGYDPAPDVEALVDAWPRPSFHAHRCRGGNRRLHPRRRRPMPAG